MVRNSIISVALAGNPNSGKTSLFNLIAGANQKVGNFAGVTVEKIEGIVKYKGYTLKIIDLPGTYSLSAYSPEEIVTREFIIENKPDVVINVVDASNLERNLYFTTQLMELQTKFVIALNMFDEIEKNKVVIKWDLLEQLFGTHIIPTSAKSKTGINELLDHVIDVFEERINPQFKLFYQSEIENRFEALRQILSTDKELDNKYNTHWLAIKLLENDKIVYRLLKERPVWIKVISFLSETNKFLENTYGGDPELIITENRHAFIKGALKEAVIFPVTSKRNFTEILDIVLINRITGIPVFLFFMWFMFQLVFKVGEIPMRWIESVFVWFGMMVGDHISNALIKSLIVDGMISGVGGVVVFLPNIMLLFLFLAFLEGSGYMSRAAFVIDKVMHVFGLHGKSAISLITGFGCSVPAFMSTRTLKSNSDRITTLLIIPFMSCGAKLPVYILFIGAFFKPEMSGNVLFSLYLFGILMALLSAKLFKTTLFKGHSEPFVMELPKYRLPSLRYLLFQMWHKAASYMRKAATIILLASMIIWMGTNFPKSDEITRNYNALKLKAEQEMTNNPDQKKDELLQLEKSEAAEQIEYSFVGKIGKTIEPVIKPIGFDWRIGISLLTGLVAKEIVVSTLATLFSLGEDDPASGVSLQKKLRSESNYNVATAIALLLFVLLYVPCIAATTVFYRESKKWSFTLFYIIYSTSFAWIVAFISYRITSLFVI